MIDALHIDWLDTTTVAGISAANLLWALLVACLSYLALSTALRLAIQRAGRLVGRTATRVDDFIVEVLASTHRGLIFLMSMLIGVGFLDLPGRWQGRVDHLWFLVLALQIGLWAHRAVRIGLLRYQERHAADAATRVGAAGTLLAWGLSTLVWAVVLLAVLSNVGVNITAFVASLGVGGIAVALAVQNILGDLFASVAIAVDKPFEVGDFIVIGSVAGTVEQIGLKTTRIRSLGGEQIVMSNTELLKQTINNYKRLLQRRIVFTFGVMHDTPADKVEALAGTVRRVIEASERVRFDRAHFKGFGEGSLDFEAVYIVLDPSFNIYMDEQQRINLALLREFEAAGVVFARPTSTVTVRSEPRSAPDGTAAPAPFGRPSDAAPA
ncbi:mechanosensitive ion channel family protein [Aquincola sp. MAHUQ-54]|uniref:Mechanosensitive ion channel family protein n=1 Tax=Aquincola agrisoli TaxID=3119538 RepID=A0AAW9QD06_9BURK